MAMMFPVHLPDLPFRWDDQMCYVQDSPVLQSAYIENYERKNKAEHAKDNMTYVSAQVCGLRELESDAEDDDSPTTLPNTGN